jgi:hypothetical protein
MRIIFDRFVVSNVRTFIRDEGNVFTYIEGVEVGGFIVSARIVGKVLEPEFKNFIGEIVSLELSDIEFLSKDKRVLSVVASDASLLVSQGG